LIRTPLSKRGLEIDGPGAHTRSHVGEVLAGHEQFPSPALRQTQTPLVGRVQRRQRSSKPVERI
jgi:hypothetical protein